MFGMSAKDRLAMFQSKAEDASSKKTTSTAPKKVGRLSIGGGKKEAAEVKEVKSKTTKKVTKTTKKKVEEKTVDGKVEVKAETKTETKTEEVIDSGSEPKVEQKIETKEETVKYLKEKDQSSETKSEKDQSKEKQEMKPGKGKEYAAEAKENAAEKKELEETHPDKKTKQKKEALSKNIKTEPESKGKLQEKKETESAKKVEKPEKTEEQKDIPAKKSEKPEKTEETKDLPSGKKSEKPEKTEERKNLPSEEKSKQVPKVRQEAGKPEEKQNVQLKHAGESEATTKDLVHTEQEHKPPESKPAEKEEEISKQKQIEKATSKETKPQKEEEEKVKEEKHVDASPALTISKPTVPSTDVSEAGRPIASVAKPNVPETSLSLKAPVVALSKPDVPESKLEEVKPSAEVAKPTVPETKLSPPDTSPPEPATPELDLDLELEVNLQMISDAETPTPQPAQGSTPDKVPDNVVTNDETIVIQESIVVDDATQKETIATEGDVSVDGGFQISFDVTTDEDAFTQEMAEVVVEKPTVGTITGKESEKIVPANPPPCDREAKVETVAEPVVAVTAQEDQEVEEILEVSKGEATAPSDLDETKEVIMTKTFTESLFPEQEFKPIPEEFYNTLFYFSGMGAVIGSAISQGVYVSEGTAKSSLDMEFLEEREKQKDEKVKKSTTVVKSARQQATDLSVDLKHLQALLDGMPSFSDTGTDGGQPPGRRQQPVVEKPLHSHPAQQHHTAPFPHTGLGLVGQRSAEYAQNVQQQYPQVAVAATRQPRAHLPGPHVVQHSPVAGTHMPVGETNIVPTVMTEKKRMIEVDQQDDDDFSKLTVTEDQQDSMAPGGQPVSEAEIQPVEKLKTETVVPLPSGEKDVKKEEPEPVPKPGWQQPAASFQPGHPVQKNEVGRQEQYPVKPSVPEPPKEGVNIYGIFEPSVIHESKPWQERYGKKRADQQDKHPLAPSFSKPRAYSVGGAIDSKDLKPWQISRARAMEAKGVTLVDESGLTPGVATATSLVDLSWSAPVPYSNKIREPVRDMRQVKKVSAFHPVAAGTFKPKGFHPVSAPSKPMVFQPAPPLSTSAGPAGIKVTPLPFQPVAPVVPSWASVQKGLPYCDL